MMRVTASTIFGLAVVTAGWSTLRIGGVALFDLIFPFSALLSIMFLPQKYNNRSSYFYYLITPALLISLIFSCGMASDVLQNSIRWSNMSLGIILLLALHYTVTTRVPLKSDTILLCVALGGIISSLIVLAQLRLGWFTGLINLSPDSDGEIKEWTRVTGLSEHPIETAGVIAISSLACLQLLSTRYRMVGFVGLPTCIVGVLQVESLTITLSLFVAYFIYFVATKRFRLIGAIIVLGLLAVNFADQISPRLAELLQSGLEYRTVESRSFQLDEVVRQINFTTFLFGKGYLASELPEGLEIHNGFLASLFHFGIFGLCSQLLMMGLVVRVLFDARVPNKYRFGFLSVFAIFFACYISGPTLTRRSLWAPIVAISAASVTQRTNARQTDTFMLTGHSNTNAHGVSM